MVAACAAVATGCAGAVPNQGDPSAPVLVKGSILDAAGKPVGNVTLQLEVFDLTAAPVGQRVPLAYHAMFGNQLDGTFAIHLTPTPELTAFSQQNGGFVNFHLMAIYPGDQLLIPSGFPREIAGNAWAGEVPTLELKPQGP
jgi:hypothetical protein